MPFASFQRWLPAGVLAAGCGLLLVAGQQQRMSLVRPLSGIPMQILGVTGKDVAVTPEVQAVAGMSSYVLRTFMTGDGGFSIYVGYYEAQTQGRSIHSPKNCLPGAGWEPMIAGATTFAVAGRAVSVNRYIIGNGPSTALVY